MSKKIMIVSMLLLCSAAHAAWNDSIVNLKNQSIYTLPKLVSALGHPQVVILAEAHDSIPEHINQVRLLNEVSKQGKIESVSVGMEFFDYTKQELVDKYLLGELSDADFLKSVGWGKNNFALYKHQVLFPAYHQGMCYALNLPRSISNKIAFGGGLAALTPKEAAMLPPDFEVGNPQYRKRFVKYMSVVHPEIPADMMQDVFTGHSSWDDTMAWKISEALENNPYQTIFVIMGRFHIEYGGGLPDRLRARGVNKVLTITQYDATQGKLGDLLKTLQHTQNMVSYRI